MRYNLLDSSNFVVNNSCLGVLVSIVQSLKIGCCALLLSASSLISANELRQTRLEIAEHRLQTEIAITPQERAQGLMDRAQLAEDSAMLFVFQQAQQQCFWMRNTLIPLTIAFLADDGAILQLTDMTPLSLESHCSEDSVRLALEVNQGWFEARGLGVGDQFNPRAWSLLIRR